MFKPGYFTLFILAFLTLNTHSQVLIGTVTDSEYNPLVQAEIQDTTSRKSAVCDLFGSFILNITSNSVLEISHPEYASRFFPIVTEQNTDTIYLNFLLTEKTQSISEVIITSDRLKKVVDQKSINVVDYLPFNDFILVIKSKNTNRFLSLEGIDTTFAEFDLGKIKAKALFEDCYGNIHLLDKDSAYQIWIDSGFHVVSTASIERFNKLLKPCIADFSENNVFYNFTNRNRKYTLTSIDKKSKQKEFFFHTHDKVGESVATSYFWSIIRIYNQAIPEYANMITLGVWDGNLLTLNFSSPEFDRMVTWYLKIRAVELNINAFRKNNNLIVFDQFSDSIHVFNDQNNQMISRTYPFEKGSKVFDVIQDRFNSTFYEQKIEKGVYTLTSLNHVFENGSPNKQITISEIPFATNMKVFNDWVYFTVLENNFNRLYRMNIPVIQSIR